MRVLVRVSLVGFILAAAPQVRAEPPAEPRWSVGAGIFTVFSDSLFSPLSPNTIVPSAQASLERRIAGPTWLVVGVAGAFETDDAAPSTFPTLSGDGGSSVRGQVAAGVRRELTAPGAPFAFSAIVLANVGGVRADRRFLAFPAGGADLIEVREDSRVLLAGVSAGAAVDRQLTYGLSLRIASQLVNAGWSWTEVKPTNGSARHVRAFRGGLVLAPSLELRLAF